MKKFFVFLLFNFCFQIIHAEYIALDSLNINDACIYRQKVIMHVESNVMSDEKIVVCEFAEKDTLYILSNAFNQDNYDLMQKFDDITSLVSKLRSIYLEEGDCESCGYQMLIDGYTPTTLNLYTFLDTIQYTTTPYPEFKVATIRDDKFGPPNIRCGISKQDLFHIYFRERLYYDYMQYNCIVLVPVDFLHFKKNKKIVLKILTFQLQFVDNILHKIQIKSNTMPEENVVREFYKFLDFNFY